MFSRGAMSPTFFLLGPRHAITQADGRFTLSFKEVVDDRQQSCVLPTSVVSSIQSHRAKGKHELWDIERFACTTQCQYGHAVHVV
jgi:hypothetical protein